MKLSLREIKAEVVNKVMKKNTHLPSLTLAKLIYKDNVELFASVEAVRVYVRRRRDAMGDKQKKRYTGPRFFKT